MADEKNVQEPMELLKQARELVADLQEQNTKLSEDVKTKDAAIDTLQKHINENRESEVIDDNTKTRAEKMASVMVERGIITPITKDAVTRKLTKTAGLQECVEQLLPRVTTSLGDSVVTKNASQSAHDADDKYFQSLGV